MAEHTKIEWTDHTFNPWIGCQKVSPGCDHCYAEAQNAFRKWTAGGKWGPHAERHRTSKAYWRQPYRWAKQANGRRPRVFCASLADWLDNKVPATWRDDLIALIEATPALDWLLLTKRIENFGRLVPSWRDGPPPNVWLGVTAEDGEHYHRRWSILADIPAVVRFISYEPALGLLELGEPLPDWIICGGESGPGARTMDPAWARSLRDQCSALRVAFFMKQMTGKKPIPADLLVRQFPKGGIAS
jgi:protein gp37